MATGFDAPLVPSKAPDIEVQASLNAQVQGLFNADAMKELTHVPPLNDGFIIENEELDFSKRYENPGSFEPIERFQLQEQPQTLEIIEPQGGKSNPVSNFLEIVNSIPENVTPEEYEEDYRSQMEPFIEEQAKIANDAKVAFENNPVLLSFLEQSQGALDRLKAAMGPDFDKQPFNDLIKQFPLHLYSNQGDAGAIMKALEENVTEEQRGPLADYISKLLDVGFKNMDKAPEIVMAFEMYQGQSLLQQHMEDILHALDEEYYQ